MGCSESAAVAVAQPKQVRVDPPLPTSKQEEPLHFLLGNIREEEYLFARVSLTNRSIDRLTIPQGYMPYNYSSMLQFQPKRFLISGGINFELTDITSNSFIYEAHSHTVAKIASMNEPRYTHASLLFGGELYVFGGRYFGEDQVAILGNCEKYSFVKNQWTVLPDMNVNRCTCYALSWKQQIYVFGGYTGKFERSDVIERLQNDQKWVVLNFNLQRGIESAFTIATGANQVTIFGGNTNSGSTASVSTINWQDQTIISQKKLKQLKTLHKSFKIADDVYIFGGSQKLLLQIYNLATKQSEIIDIKLNEQFNAETFEVLTQSQRNLVVEYSDRNEEKLKSDGGDEVVLVFGQMEEPFVLELNLTAPFAEMHSVPLPLRLYTEGGGTYLKDYEYLIFGGMSDDSLTEVSSATYTYNHKSRKTAKLQDMHTARYSFACERINNRVYALGGGKGDENADLVIISDCEYFDLQTLTWKEIARLPIGLISAMSVSFQGTLYVIGGISEAKQMSRAIYRYDHTADKWSKLSYELPYGMQGAGIYRVKENEFYLFGGKTAKGEIDAIHSLKFKATGSSECELANIGTMVEKGSGMSVFKPAKLNLFVVMGGQSQIVSFYDTETLKPVESSDLASLKQLFLSQTSSLNANLPRYLSITNHNLQ